jgi:hypothetical protein
LDERTVRAEFRRLWIENRMPDEREVFGADLDDVIAEVLVNKSHPLPERLIPTWAVAPAIIGVLLDVGYRDPVERNRLLKAVPRHQDLFDGVIRVVDYADEPPAESLGIGVLPCASALTVVWLDVGGSPGWLAALLRGVFDTPRVYGRQPGDPWIDVARATAARLRDDVRE